MASSSSRPCRARKVLRWPSCRATVWTIARLREASTLARARLRAHMVLLPGRRRGEHARPARLHRPASSARPRPGAKARALRAPAIATRRDGRPAPTRGARCWSSTAPSFLRTIIAPILALADALAARRMAVEAVFVASLKDEASEAFLREAIGAFKPDVIVNTTAFSARGADGGVLDLADAPVLQAALATSTREAWASVEARRQWRRSRDEHRAARGRRPHLHPRDFLQGAGAARFSPASSRKRAMRRNLRASPSSRSSPPIGPRCAARRTAKKASR